VTLQPVGERLARQRLGERSQHGEGKLQAPAKAKTVMDEQGGKEVERWRESPGREPHRAPTPPEHQHLKARLKRERGSLMGTIVRETKTIEEVNELRAAGQIDVLAVVDFDPIDGEGCGLSSQQTAALKEIHSASGPFEMHRRSETGQAAADHCYMA